MYNNYFTFSCSPFESTLDQRFLFMSECHEEVIAALLYFAREKKSFALVSGDVGTGKTMIVHHFLGRLPPSVLPILVPYPQVEYLEILRYIAREFRICTEGKSVLELSDDVKAELTKASAGGKQVVLIIDEAHLLPDASLENIRLLSNIELTENKLLQILLIGQNELATKLRKTELRQLRQRISIARVLCPMNPAETISYIDHRLKIARSCFDVCFEPDCRKLIYEITGGVPRSINRLCDTALLICMTHKSKKVTKRILRKAHNALESDSIVMPEVTLSGLFDYAQKFRHALGASVLVLLFAAVFWGYRMNSGKLVNSSLHGAVSMPEIGASPPKSKVTAFETKVRAVPTVKAGTAVPNGAQPAHAEMPAPPPARAVPAADAVNAQPVGDIEKGAGADSAVSTHRAQDGAAPSVSKETVTADRVRKPAKPCHLAVSPTDTGPVKDRFKAEKPRSLRHEFMVVRVKEGDSLSAIAARWFPEDPASGLRSIVDANPQIHDENRIFVDQTLKIPKKN